MDNLSGRDYLSGIEIKKTSVEESYAKFTDKNIELSSGSKKSRLQFSLQSSCFAQKTADVYVEVIGDKFYHSIKSFFLSKMDRKFVKCMRGDDVIYINIDSLSKRIGISKKDIYAQAEDGKSFDSMIEAHHKKYTETEQKVDHFLEQIIEEKYTKEGDKIKTADGKVISKGTLHKMLGIAAFYKFDLKEEKEIAFSLKDKTILLLQKQENSEWPLLTLFTENVLGEGCFGRVQVVEELSMGRVSVAKIAHHSTGQKDIDNENEILSLFKDSRSVGIQQKPYSSFHFKSENKTYYGYIAPKYGGNLTRIMPRLTPNEKIACAKQLLGGLAELAKRQIRHGDIKFDNCLLKRNREGFIECVIADFGGASSMLDGVKSSNYGNLLYTCEGDDKAHSSLYRQYASAESKEDQDKIEKDIKDLFLKRDVFLMGLVIKKLLCPCADTAKSEEVNKLIEKMTNRSWKERISAAEALLELKIIFPDPC